MAPLVANSSVVHPQQLCLRPRLHRWRFSLPSPRCVNSGELSLPGVADPLGNSAERSKGKGRVFFLDVNPLCFDGSQPSLRSFARWVDLFFSRVSLRDPVIAVLDGEEGNEYRKRLLPSYKAHRSKYLRRSRIFGNARQDFLSTTEPQIVDVLLKCNVPVIKVHGYEADDVIATLTDQVLQKGLRVVIGSPDKDFKQLISEEVQIVMPLPDIGRWSFYTIKHYIDQYKCDPSSDLSLRMLVFRLMLIGYQKEAHTTTQRHCRISSESWGKDMKDRSYIRDDQLQWLVSKPQIPVIVSDDV